MMNAADTPDASDGDETVSMTRHHAEQGGAGASEAALDTGPIVARSDRRHLLYRCILLPLFVAGCGVAFAYDGWIGWPRSNEKFELLSHQAENAKAFGDAKGEAEFLSQRKDIKFRSPFDIRLQKILGVSLPLLAVVAFAYFYSLQRGQIRLEGDVLYLPGHPPVPLDAIREIDKSRWDTKGIALLRYELDQPETGKRGTLRLDDALYEQKPVGRILAYIEKTLVSEDVSEEVHTPDNV